MDDWVEGLSSRKAKGGWIMKLIKKKRRGGGITQSFTSQDFFLKKTVMECLRSKKRIKALDSTTHRQTDTHTHTHTQQAPLRASRAQPVLQTSEFAPLCIPRPIFSLAGDGSYRTEQGRQRGAHPRQLACAPSPVTAEDGRREAVNGEPKFQPRHPHTSTCARYAAAGSWRPGCRTRQRIAP